MKIEDYTKYLEVKDYNFIYNDITNKVLELVNEIISVRSFNIDLENKDIKEQLDILKYEFERKSSMFSFIGDIARDLINFGTIYGDTIEGQLKRYTDKYNILTDKLNTYNSWKQKIEDKDINEVIDNYKSMFIKLYKNILANRNKIYDENIDFSSLSKLMYGTDAYYNELIKNVDNIINHQIFYYESNMEDISYEVESDYTELVIFLDDTYQELSNELK